MNDAQVNFVIKALTMTFVVGMVIGVLLGAVFL